MRRYIDLRSAAIDFRSEAIFPFVQNREKLTPCKFYRFGKYLKIRIETNLIFHRNKLNFICEK